MPRWCARRRFVCRRGERFVFDWQIVRGMLGISLPMALEHAALCGAQIASTRIIAPLGTVSIAANSFAVTAESLCYMPGYGIGNAATTVIDKAPAPAARTWRAALPTCRSSWASG